MKKILAVICGLSLIFNLVACESTAGTQIYIQTKDGHRITFQLNESWAAASFYAQLPLDILVEDYANSEKTFYPPEKLDISDAPMAEGPIGTLAYYEPWGNIAIFYEECHEASGLYELGEAVAGAKLLADLNGELHISTLP